MPHKVLVIFTHPNYDNSIANRALREAITSLSHVTIHDLYTHYSDFFIHVKQEQKLVEQHDVIVFQHPFYWYHAPALLKEWLDMVLEHGWAYGEGGTKLHGKYWQHAITTGGPQMAYQRDGYNHFSMNEFLRPFEQSAHLCGAHYLAPFVVHGVRQLSEDDLQKQCALYRTHIEKLTRGENLVPFNTM